MKKLILSIISFLVIASVPIVAHAILVVIDPVDGPPITLGDLDSTAPVFIAGNYGSFEIKDQSATSRARVYLNVQPTYKTMVLTNAIIKNTSALDTAVKNIDIRFKHTFTPNVSPSADQFYSLGMSGFFKRATGTTLAAGSNITLLGFGTFGTGGDELLERIVNASPERDSLSHTVGSTNSFVDPTPSLKDNFSCNDVALAQDSSCPVVGSLVPTSLLIVVSLNLKGQHSLTVSSSFDSIGADNEADRDLAQALLNLPVEILSGTVNLKKNGVVPVVIYGSEDYDPTHPITGIDPNTVEFMGAFEKHGRGHIEDVNRDTLPDLVLHFSVPETYLACGDTLASLTGETFPPAGQSIGKPIGGSAEINLQCK